MLARSYQDIAPYDAAVTQLRDYFDRLRRDGTDWSVPRPQRPAIARLNQNRNVDPDRVNEHLLTEIPPFFRKEVVVKMLKITSWRVVWLCAAQLHQPARPTSRPPRPATPMPKRPWRSCRNWSAAPGSIKIRSSSSRIATNGHSATRSSAVSASRTKVVRMKPGLKQSRPRSREQHGLLSRLPRGKQRIQGNRQTRRRRRDLRIRDNHR